MRTKNPLKVPKVQYLQQLVVYCPLVLAQKLTSPLTLKGGFSEPKNNPQIKVCRVEPGKSEAFCLCKKAKNGIKHCKYGKNGNLTSVLRFIKYKNNRQEFIKYLCCGIFVCLKILREKYLPVWFCCVIIR